jgi:hypothetical protein
LGTFRQVTGRRLLWSGRREGNGPFQGSPEGSVHVPLGRELQVSMTYQGRSHLPVDVVGMELNLYFPALLLQPLKTETVCFSETSTSTCKSTRRQTQDFNMITVIMTTSDLNNYYDDDSNNNPLILLP